MVDQVNGCVSFSLYGDGAKYAQGMVENVPLVQKYYPGWQCRVYLERGHYAKAALLKAGARVIDMEPLPGSGGMFWRLFAADDPQFTHVIFRDADSRVNPREVACVEAWITSGKTLHVIRDHPAHLSKPIMGGAWGMLSGGLRMRDAVDNWSHNYQYGDDEDFLWRVVWEKFRAIGDFVTHSFAPSDYLEVRVPEHTEYDGFVCEQIEATLSLPGTVASVVLSPEHYKDRRDNFFASLRQNGGELLNSKTIWVKGSDARTRILPRHFPHVESLPHYYWASRDHIDILENHYLQGVDYLFVFEDDASFRSDFEEHLMRALIAVPDGWMGIQLGGQSWSDSKRSYYIQDGEIAFPAALARVNGCLGMHGVLWNRRGMLRAWNHFHFHHLTTVDQAFVTLQKEEPHFYSASRWVVEIDSTAVQFGGDR